MGFLLAFFGALIAAIWDIETRRVPNGLIFLMWGGAALLCAISGSELTAAESAVGAALPVAGLWPLFHLRLMGAGDVKLLSGIGGLIGAGGVTRCFAAAVFCAGLISFFLILCRGIAAARHEPIHFAVPVLMGVMLVTGGVAG